MMGTSRTTGQAIGDEARLAQSIGDILSTPKGSRVMRRDYGSDLPLLIDQPMNGETVVDVFMATAEAIDRWEPEYQLTRVEIVTASAGRMELRLSGDIGPLTIEVGT